MAITLRDNRIILNEADAITSWVATDGPTVFTTAPSPVEATACLAMQASNEVQDAYFPITSDDYSGGGSLFILMADRAEFDTTTAGGIGIQVGDGTNRIAYHVGGSDGTGFRHDVGAVKWASFQIDLANKPTNFTAIAGAEVNLNEAAITQVGVRFSTVAKSVGGADNVFWDIIRFAHNGVGMEIYGGTLSTPENWATVATEDRNTGNQRAHYLIREVGTGAYDIQGNLSIGDGNGTSATYLDSTLETFLWADRGQSTNNYYRFNGSGNTTSVTDINFDNCIFNNALSGSMDFSDANSTADFRTCTFIGWDKGILNGNSGNTWTSNTYIGCGQVETSGATMTNSTFFDFSGATDESYIFWNTTLDVDGYIDGSEFIKGDGSHHAITFPPEMSGTSITLRNINFSSFNATSGNTDSALLVQATSGTLTINIIGGSGDVTARSSGSSVNIVQNPVTFTLTAQNVAGDPIEGARAYIVAASGGSLSQGTVIINTTTDVNGEVSDTRTYSINQPIEGWLRKGTNTPRYRQSPVAGTINSANGLDLTSVMVLDE